MSWVKIGIFWGISMFIINGIVFPLNDNRTITVQTIIIQLVIWSIGGLLFGYFLKFGVSKKKTD